MSVQRGRGRLGYNMMLFDMGVEIQPQLTPDEVLQAVEAADQLFDVVMVAERLDESLILMKEKFCWKFSDIVFFTKNARRNDNVLKLSKENVDKLRLLNSADVLLYKHFLAKHERAVMQYGETKMAEQIKLLNSYRMKIFKSCNVIVAQSFQPESIFREFSDQVNGYIVDTNASDDCLLLTLPELSLVEMIRRKNLQLVNMAYAKERSANRK